jgi:hypothetical protein
MHARWEVEVSDEFESWWRSLPAPAQEAIAHDVEVLRAIGPALGRPWVDSVRGSRHPNMKELRTRVGRSAYRILFAFDPRRTAILLVGGDKSGAARFYARMLEAADRIYDAHLNAIDPRGSETRGSKT